MTNVTHIYTGPVKEAFDRHASTLTCNRINAAVATDQPKSSKRLLTNAAMYDFLVKQGHADVAETWLNTLEELA